MLSQFREQRSFNNNLVLACVTACTAGMTNIAGAMACYAFTSNVTGHAVHFARHMLTGNFFEMFVMIGWLLMFILGAGIAHFLIRSYEFNGPYFAHALPIFIVLCLLVFVGIYGHYINENSDRDVLIISAILLFSMGVQNSAVNTISDGKIKTSHLTGVSTDLGADLSEWLHPKTFNTPQLAQKIQLRASILLLYISGAVVGGWMYTKIKFVTFYIIAIALLLIIVYDLMVMSVQKENKPG